MSHSLSLLPLALFIVLMMASPLGGYLLYQKKQISSLVIVSGITLFLATSYFILRLAGIHIVGEEGDYILICMVFVLWTTAGFQFLRIQHPWAGKAAFTLLMSPMIVVFPYLGWLLICTLKWVFT